MIVFTLHVLHFQERDGRNQKKTHTRYVWMNLNKFFSGVSFNAPHAWRVAKPDQRGRRYPRGEWHLIPRTTCTRPQVLFICGRNIRKSMTRIVSKDSNLIKIITAVRAFATRMPELRWLFFVNPIQVIALARRISGYWRTYTQFT